MSRIAVLMTCHNRKDMTLRCLGSLREQIVEAGGDDQWKLDIFLVDDGCTDGTSEKVAELGEGKLWKIHVIKGSGNDYWAKGMARAWQAALEFEKKSQSTPTPTFYAYFLWLNDDVVLKPNALIKLINDAVANHQFHQSPVVIGACSTDARETASSFSATDQHDVQIFPNGAPQLAKGWFNGNCVLMPRSVYEQVGMIDGAYSHARADYDYAERLKRAGVPFCCSSQFVGVCDNDRIRRKQPRSILARLALLFKPGYVNLADMFRYRFRYYGLTRAVVSCLHLVWIVGVGESRG